VIAKPAEETPLIAAQAVRLFLGAGLPQGALQLLPGDGKIGARLVADPAIAGVVFTGSTEAARAIQRQLAQRLGRDGQAGAADRRDRRPECAGRRLLGRCPSSWSATC
jgi:RHH-type proline utilization regulon transcriptional repressor/proline dehydrogenase/delta 1-pyrroline-5-carboxylate dehydrogenase